MLNKEEFEKYCNIISTEGKKITEVCNILKIDDIYEGPIGKIIENYIDLLITSMDIDDANGEVFEIIFNLLYGYENYIDIWFEDGDSYRITLNNLYDTLKKMRNK